MILRQINVLKELVGPGSGGVEGGPGGVPGWAGGQQHAPGIDLETTKNPLLKVASFSNIVWKFYLTCLFVFLVLILFGKV